MSSSCFAIRKNPLMLQIRIWQKSKVIVMRITVITRLIPFTNRKKTRYSTTDEHSKWVQTEKVEDLECSPSGKFREGQNWK